ncbi:MAG: DUF1549 domain-containing protein, partial [Planctomycetota bacterium]
RLTAQQIEYVEAWIRGGAAWPDAAAQAAYIEEENQREETDEGIRVVTSGGTSQQWTNRRYQRKDLWAFQPVANRDALVPPSLSKPSDKEVDTTSVINQFLSQALRDRGLQAAADADPRSLIRRATFDLTGLPPTPQQVDEFVDAYTANPGTAWPALVQRLLDSPAYGEHWARHWMDVTRYADTGGFSNDYERSNMWRYRDYVIRSFNKDKPYNEFVVEQLAGDELAADSVRKRHDGDEAAVVAAETKGDYNPQESEWIVASGFLRLGPWDNAMVMPAEARQLYLDDVVNITGQTFLSTTMRCCRCHDHKFDPIPTRDYYRMYAAFSTTHMAERQVPMLESENQQGFDEGRAHVQRMLQYAVDAKNELINKRETAARKWYKEHDLPYKDLNARKNLDDDQKPPRHVGLTPAEQGVLKVREQDEWIWRRRLERYQPMAQSVFNANDSVMPW